MTLFATEVLPPGFFYRRDFLRGDDEQRIVRGLSDLPFGEVRMRGAVAKRRVIHFGWDYDYSGWKITPAQPMPPMILELRDRCASELGTEAASLEQVLIACYPPGAGIGWHRDAPMFGQPVVGLSLVSDCVMRFRRSAGERSIPVTLEHRSLYALSGEARSKWQHSIPSAKSLRYSITFRTLRQ